MIARKTVLILGAGSSVDYGFPTGKTLRGLILREDFLSAAETESILRGEMTDLGYDMWQKAYAGVESPLAVFRREFAAANGVSIDRFVAVHRKYERIARLLIAAILLRYEQATVSEKWPEIFWYTKLFIHLISDGPDIEDQKLTVVTFNYERSLEEFLIRAFQGYLVCSRNDAVEKVRRIRFIHVYGSFGDLLTGDARGVGYAVNHIHKAIEPIELARESTDSGDPSTHTPAIVEALLAAERWAFMGFAYDPLNLRALGFSPDDAPQANSLREKAQHLSHASGLHLGDFGLDRSDQDRAWRYIGGHVDFTKGNANSFISATPLFD